MDISVNINGKPADITFEDEKTVEDLLVGISAWLRESESSITAVTIDGKYINSITLQDVFEKELADIKQIDITVSSWQEVALEALYGIKKDMQDYVRGSFKEREEMRKLWDGSVIAKFFEDQMPDLFQYIKNVFLGDGLLADSIDKIIDERIYEIIEPIAELKCMGDSVSEVAALLEDIPLDIQTGKDDKAAVTIQRFSHVTEKLFRLIRLLKLQDSDLDKVSIDDIPLYNFIDEYRSALRELVSAYEVRDAVLVGDLAEYELSPRLLKLYAALTRG